MEEQGVRLDYLTRALASAGALSLQGADKRLSALSAKLDALSPLKVLCRGFTVAQNKDGRLVRSVKDIQPESQIELKLIDGSARCRVEEVIKVNDNE